MPMDINVFDSILQDIAAGEPAHRALHARGSNYRAFYGLLNGDLAARERYARAKFDGLERIADETLAIADECPPEVDGRLDAAYVQWQRSRIETRKWLLSKLAPKRYGDHLELTVGSSTAAMAMTRDELLSLVVDKAKRIQAPVEGEDKGEGVDLTRTNVHQEGE